MNNEIRHQLFYQHPASVVWEYLVNPERMVEWLMPNDFLPVVGHDFQFKTKPIPQLDFDGIFYCKVVELVHLRRLSYSWKCGPGGGRLTTDSLVSWTLEPKDNGTLLSLVHSGFTETNLTMYNALSDGWLKNMQKIADRINTQHDGKKP